MDRKSNGQFLPPHHDDFSVGDQVRNKDGLLGRIENIDVEKYPSLLVRYSSKHPQFGHIVGLKWDHVENIQHVEETPETLTRITVRLNSSEMFSKRVSDYWVSSNGDLILDTKTAVTTYASGTWTYIKEDK